MLIGVDMLICSMSAIFDDQLARYIHRVFVITFLSKSVWTLRIHHDPLQKDFPISRILASASWLALLAAFV